MDAAIALMAGLPSGTRFIVGLTITDAAGNQGGHWVYADNVAGKVTFFDFQRDHFASLVRARRTADHQATMAKLSADVQAGKKGAGANMRAAKFGGNMLTFDTDGAPPGPRRGSTPVIYDYNKDIVHPPAMRPSSVLFIAFKPALDRVTRLRAQVGA